MPTTIIPRNATMNAHAGLILSALIIGFSFPAVGAIGEGLPPLLLTALRFAIAAIAITPLLARLPLERPSATGLVLYALMGLCLTAFFGTMFWAAHHASAQSMATLYVSVPLMAYGFGRLLQVEGSSPRLLVLLLVGAGGGPGDEHSRTFEEEDALERKKAALDKMKQLLQAEAAFLDEEKRWLSNEKKKVRKQRGVSFGSAGEEDSHVFASNRTDPAFYAQLGDEEKDVRILKGKLQLETKLNKELNKELGLEIENLSKHACGNALQARRRSALRRSRRS